MPENEYLTDREKLVQLREKYVELKNEFDNYRTRVNEEKKKLADASSLMFLQKIIGNLDILFTWAHSGKASTTVEHGLLLAIKDIYNVLGQLGLSRINTETGFDPHYHEAIDVVPTNQLDYDNEVVHTHCNGYIFNDSLVNPAKVTVCKYVERKSKRF